MTLFSAELPVMFSFVQVSGYLCMLENPKNIYIKSASWKLPRDQRGATEQPGGSQEGAWHSLGPGRATCPPGWVPPPLVPYFGPIYSPDAKPPKQKSLFQSTSQSRRNPLFFSGE